ncbi:3-hydroxyacyl-CoA dehydrogenase family protein [Flectobacillus roseus]|uniref:3-hydroxyacyl-CoA dehydrogenase family protein n=1 Tax=Flectobacillus roseus TaxID=502259 RepID=UPI0024B6DF1C|nr:3-hydroxyacyl-CoA dehydrogenase NAD-binding domain-containing protein [Flectobacillus roseus]MDI9867622.1 3-hydroxyacyl-CoA dehydrogenase NAD-binding domain-containing protein [Flectobacillus roseus]
MKNIAVIGAGTMGNGIAHSFAQNGFKVALVDTNEEVLGNALKIIQQNLERQVKKGLITPEIQSKTILLIESFTSIEKAVQKADLVVEAVSEAPTLKKSTFQELDKQCPEACILATNTSSISITQIASYTQRPDKVIGMHFMNPVPVMKLVEIIKGYSTSEETYQAVHAYTKALDKIPVVVNDYPGFIANRILMPMINEAIISLFEGVAGVAEIDAIMKLGMAHPMGPLQLADFIGLDTCLSILKVLYDGFKNPKYAPCPLLVNMVQAGKLGVKSGEGFYSYAKGSKEAEVSQRFR